MPLYSVRLDTENKLPWIRSVDIYVHGGCVWRAYISLVNVHVNVLVFFRVFEMVIVLL